MNSELIDRMKYAQKIEGERQVCLWLHERGICDKEICQFCKREADSKEADAHVNK